MLRLGQEQNLSVVCDQIGRPPLLPMLARVTLRAPSRRWPILPYVASIMLRDGETSWYDHARFIFAEARKWRRISR